jgi:hypothetical protein
MEDWLRQTIEASIFKYALEIRTAHIMGAVLPFLLIQEKK